MAALNVNIYVSDVQVSESGNNYSVTAILAPNDTSGLSNFSLNFQGPGITPRYQPGNTGTIVLP